ncbi:hypothetical protein AO369_0391 [Moraxella catarrhalis]|nr:hypothetical protein AO369_0391 [Moraxella catarrhalis]
MAKNQANKNPLKLISLRDYEFAKTTIIELTVPYIKKYLYK